MGNSAAGGPRCSSNGRGDDEIHSKFANEKNNRGGKKNTGSGEQHFATWRMSKIKGKADAGGERRVRLLTKQQTASREGGMKAKKENADFARKQSAACERPQIASKLRVVRKSGGKRSPRKGPGKATRKVLSALWIGKDLGGRKRTLGARQHKKKIGGRPHKKKPLVRTS